MSTAETKSVNLAGVEYEVPPVSFRNAARIHPLVDKALAAVREKAKSNSPLDEATYLDLGKIVFCGIRKPEGMNEDDFLDLVIMPHEMTNAALVVARQAGLVMTPGEAAGATSPQTSTN